MADSYSSRFLSRAWVETKSFWSIYRWWVMLSGAISGVALLLERKGWGGVMDVQDVLINSVGGAGIAFFGTWVISLLRTPKLLDDDRQREISSAKQTIESQAARIKNIESRAARSPEEEHIYREAKRHLESLPEDAKEVLREISLQGRLIRGAISEVPGVPLERMMAILNQGLLHPLVRGEDYEVAGSGVRSSWVIVQGYAKPLSELLYE